MEGWLALPDVSDQWACEYWAISTELFKKGADMEYCQSSIYRAFVMSQA